MKILFVVLDGNISGGNNIATVMLRAAAKQGFDIELLSPTPGELTQALEAEGIKVHLVPLGRSFRFDRAIRLANHLKNSQIDLVHSHTTLGNEILCRLACGLSSIPIICHQHDPTDFYNQNPLISTYQKWIDRTTSSLTHNLVAVSENRQEAMVSKRGYAASKVKTIYNGINLEKFSSQTQRESVRQAWHLAPDETAIGLVARIEDPKGHATLVEAAPLVLEKYPKSKFFFIGDDRWPNQPYLAKYRQRLSDLGISDRFVFLGFSSEVHNLIQGLDIVTLPSWWEGHPLIVLEALASRKSVIASAVGGVPEIILHEETGLLVPPKNPAALAQEICRLIAEPELRSQLGEAGCQRVRQRFDETDMIQNILNLYQEVMAA